MNIEGFNIPNSLAGYKSKGIAVNVTGTSSLFATMLSDSMSSHELKILLKPRSLKDDSSELSDLKEVSVGENNYCSLCGSRIESDGSCPICIVPMFIHGTGIPLGSQGANKNISQVGGSDSTSGSKSAVLSKSSKLGRKK